MINSRSRQANSSTTSISHLSLSPSNGSAPTPYQVSNNVELFDEGSLSSSLFYVENNMAGPAATSMLHPPSNEHKGSMPTLHRTGDLTDALKQRPSSSNVTDSSSMPTTAELSYLAFFPPTDNPIHQMQGCNAYGPLCQTGFTVLSVNKTSIIATTTVACTSYLSAQSESIRADKSALLSWRSHFGRSPQCTSYAES